MAETRGAMVAEAGAAAAPHDGPVMIPIVRDYGAAGHEVGNHLSVKLGIPLYDNELSRACCP